MLSDIGSYYVFLGGRGSFYIATRLYAPPKFCAKVIMQVFTTKIVVRCFMLCVLSLVLDCEYTLS